MQGSLTAADTSVTFVIDDSAPDDGGSIAVQDGLSGKQYYESGLSSAQVRASLIVMLDGDEHEFDEELRRLAESVQPADPELRFIP